MRAHGKQLENRVCLVVGGTGAIGSAVAKQFLHEGSRLAVTYQSGPPRLEADESRANTRDLRSYHLDVTKQDEIVNTIRAVENDFGGIDVLVNCSGVIGPIGRLEDVAPLEWKHALEVNLIGPVFLAHAAIPALRRRGHGKIIFFSGGGAAYGRPYFTAYSSAKAALIRFTESLAQELRDANIQVNAIAPGPIESRMWDEMRSAAHAGGPNLADELMRMDKTGGASPDRAVALTTWLASDRSNGVTGRLVSALWDDWQNVETKIEKLINSEAWTLRRVPLE